MTKMILDIPDPLNSKITMYLGSYGLDARDKSRLILAVMEQQMEETAPPGLVKACKEAKAANCGKQKARWQERKR